MLRREFCLSLICACVVTAAPAPPRRDPPRPKLIIGIFIDQFRYDYFTRFQADYTGGFALLRDRGAVFTNARLDHFPTFTAVGHSTLFTGATPSFSGIIGNEWYDYESAKEVTSVSDDATQLLGGPPGAPGSSPRRLLVTTLGDEMKLAWQFKPRVVGISMKDRGAILPAGHMSDGCYWFDSTRGNFVSSTFYFPQLPKWVADFNASRFVDKFVNAEWTPLAPNPDWPPFSVHLGAKPGQAYYDSLEKSPYGNELVEAFAERAIESERLGRRGTTDLLSVSFSSNDYVGHEEGPQSPKVRDMSIRTDRVLGKFFQFLDQRVRLANVIVVLTADHGVSTVPEVMQAHHAPGGRLSMSAMIAAVEAALTARFGEGMWVVGHSGASLYLNRDLIRSKKLDWAGVQQSAADAIAATPHILRVYTRDQLARGHVTNDMATRRVVNGFCAPRAPDLVVIPEPFWFHAGGRGTTHGSPFTYDTHVPLILMGAAFKPGLYHMNVIPNDVAPTLATLLGVQAPAGATGRVLVEALQ